MASDSQASNQEAGKKKRHCHRAHWLAVLGAMEALQIPPEWEPQVFGDGVEDGMRQLFERQSKDNAMWLAQGAKYAARRLQIALQSVSCTCIDCQRHPRRKDDGNPHEGKVMA